jgi:glycine dehydrogenase
MIKIREEIQNIENKKIDPKNNPIKNAPHTAEELLSDAWDRPYTRQEAAYPLAWVKDNKFWAPVARIDNAFGDRNFICTCPPLEDYT